MNSKRRNILFDILLLSVVAMVVASCSTQKNTWGTRTFHAMKTKYNIRFNGELAYDEGIKAIDDANQDDFSTLIPLYSVSNHTAAQAASSQMDRTIEKCRKCIKLHSIKVKPKPDPKKRNDPKYKAWLQQEEFNPQMKEAWILLGKAEFHKGDFLGSIGTFNYIIRHFAYDKDMVAQCQLWEVRAYAEMGWMYEAEDLLQKVQQDDLAQKHAWLYAATAADLRLKQEQYKEAVPFLKLAMPEEKKQQRMRYLYLLAQLSEQQGDKKTAAQYYKRVVKMSPPADMDFNARLRRTELSNDVKALKRMVKQPKYKDKLDYVYGSLGNIYLQKKDTVEALRQYALAAENSTQNGLQKAAVLIRAGDLYYERQDYQNAAPCYKDAVNIISTEAADYERIRRRAETLDLLATELATVQLQDSLQALSKLTEEEQLKVAEKIIADLEKAEKEEAEKAAQAARNAQLDEGPLSVNTRNMIGGGGGTADWYFYNPQLIRQGKQEFTRRWGNRTLEDNWRRQIKQTSSTNIFSEDEQQDLPADSLSSDSTQTTQQMVSDTKNPQYYLQQIPKTPEQLAVSDTMIATALYNMVCIYEDKLEDRQLADETLQELNQRFPNDGHLAELYYRRYLTCLKHDNKTEAELARQQLITRFPNSKQAQTAANPDYFAQLQRIEAEQDSVYEQAYKAFRKNDFQEVKRLKNYAEDNYQLSPLMPRFLFLNAIAVARTENQDAFIEALRDMVRRYPDSETGAMAKDMLAMMNAGLESQTGDNSTLLDRRTETSPVDSALLEQTFSTEKQEKSSVLVLVHSDEKTLNNLLYEVALFNFSQFLIKDFDLKVIPVFSVTDGALIVSGFESYDEALWYVDIMKGNPELQTLFNKENARIITITDRNLPLLNTRFTIEEYEQFRQENL
ncbi:MAG: hypothetical protein IJ650_01245 [Paludibacteraceae bacterium]|nr:hypothetical protein [Paludibacteraceae bacterium]